MSSWAPMFISSLPVVFPTERYRISWPISDIYMFPWLQIDHLPDRVHPTRSETKYHVFNNKITDNVDFYHSEATMLKPKVCTMKNTKKHKDTYCNYSYTTSKPRDYIRTFTILLITTIKLQMRQIHFYGYIKLYKLPSAIHHANHIIIQHRRSYEQYPTS